MPTPSPETVAAVLRHVDASLETSRGRLFDLLRIPSISAQPAHTADCARAAEWVRDQLAGLGFAAEVRPTAGHPVVVAHHRGARPAIRDRTCCSTATTTCSRSIRWTSGRSPPFEPQLVDGPHGKRFVARGAVDDKGQVDDVHRGPARLEGRRAAASPPASPC